MKKLLELILDSIFDNKDITVDETEEDGIITLTIHAPQEEMGKIIGKKGKVINSMKQVIKILAIKEDKKVELQVAEN